jgi:hypothetical protein
MGLETREPSWKLAGNMTGGLVARGLVIRDWASHDPKLVSVGLPMGLETRLWSTSCEKPPKCIDGEGFAWTLGVGAALGIGRGGRGGAGSNPLFSKCATRRPTPPPAPPPCEECW